MYAFLEIHHDTCFYIFPHLYFSSFEWRALGAAKIIVELLPILSVSHNLEGIHSNHTKTSQRDSLKSLILDHFQLVTTISNQLTRQPSDFVPLFLPPSITQITFILSQELFQRHPSTSTIWFQHHFTTTSPQQVAIHHGDQDFGDLRLVGVWTRREECKESCYILGVTKKLLAIITLSNSWLIFLF
jgi:hypothetical protein